MAALISGFTGSFYLRPPALGLLVRYIHCSPLDMSSIGADHCVPSLLVAKRKIPLASKCAVANMSVLASEGKLEALGSMCEAYLRDPGNASYKQREKRVRQLLAYAEEPSYEVLVEATLA